MFAIALLVLSSLTAPAFAKYGPRWDGSIASGSSVWVGSGIRSPHPDDQVISRAATAGSSLTFRVAVARLNHIDGRTYLTGCAGTPTIRVRYTADTSTGGRDVTGAVTGSHGWTPTVPQHARRYFRLHVHVLPGADAGRFECVVRARGLHVDAVTTRVRVTG